MLKLLLSVCGLAAWTLLSAQGEFVSLVNEKAAAINERVVQWRRHIHAQPELSNREFETAKLVAQHLTDLGMEVRTGVGITGVVGILRGSKPGKVVALRADMDALPVTERVDLPFASKVTTTYLGTETGVMHACGHDTHVAMLMGAAEILSDMRDELAGTVVFIFQPAEEGAPPGERGGAQLMVEEGVLENPKVDAIFGIHINSKTPVGVVRFKPGGALAAVNRLVIKVKGVQTHGSTPWTGVDPITVSAQIILGLQNIISRQTELTKEAAVISIGKISGGVRNNIIPEEVELVGTIRTLDRDMQADIHRRIHQTATHIAQASGATAEVNIEPGYPVTYNDPALTQLMGPTMQAVMGVDNVVLSRAITGAEDFSFYAQQVPGLFVFLGGMPPEMDPAQAAPHHTPDFYIDEAALPKGVALYANFALDYLRLADKP
ncbi:MAG: amidohydrolase [Bacteroidetes bacterium]|nr:MAG: amidohydrolase [Bacteroidota bacterium]